MKLPDLCSHTIIMEMLARISENNQARLDAENQTAKEDISFAEVLRGEADKQKGEAHYEH